MRDTSEPRVPAPSSILDTERTHARSTMGLPRDAVDAVLELRAASATRALAAAGDTAGARRGHTITPSYGAPVRYAQSVAVTRHTGQHAVITEL